MKNEFRITLNENWCKSCEICVNFCPKKVYEMGRFYPQIAQPGNCIGCMICEKMCPDFAITVRPVEEQDNLK